MIYFYICIVLIIILVLLKVNRRQIVEIDELRIDNIKIENVKVKHLERVEKLSDSDKEELSEIEEIESIDDNLNSVGDESTLSHGTVTGEAKELHPSDELTSGLNTGASTPRNTSPNPETIIMNEKSKPSPISQSDLEIILASSQVGKMILAVEVIFEKSTDFTASTLRKIVPTRVVKYLKKYL